MAEDQTTEERQEDDNEAEGTENTGANGDNRRQPSTHETGEAANEAPVRAQPEPVRFVDDEERLSEIQRQVFPLAFQDESKAMEVLSGRHVSELRGLAYKCMPESFQIDRVKRHLEKLNAPQAALFILGYFKAFHTGYGSALADAQNGRNYHAELSA